MVVVVVDVVVVVGAFGSTVGNTKSKLCVSTGGVLSGRIMSFTAPSAFAFAWQFPLPQP